MRADRRANPHALHMHTRESMAQKKIYIRITFFIG